MRPASARLDSGRRRSGRMPHVADRRRSGPSLFKGDGREMQEGRPEVRSGCPGRLRDLWLQRNEGRKGSGPACQGTILSRAVTEAMCSVTRRYRPHGEGSATGAEEHALALESAWSRNAYGARHTEDLYEVMRSVENRLGTITSLRWTEDGAWVSLRTSRTGAVTASGLLEFQNTRRLSERVQASFPEGRGAVGCCLTFARLPCPLPAVRLLWDAMSGVRNESDDAAFGAAAGNIESMVTPRFGTDAGSVTVVHHGCENLGKLDLTAAAFGAETKHLTAASANKGGGFPDSACAHCGPHSQPLPLRRPGGFLPIMDLRDAFLTGPSNPVYEARSIQHARRPSSRYSDGGRRHRQRLGHPRSRNIGRPKVFSGRTVDGRT